MEPFKAFCESSDETFTCGYLNNILKRATASGLYAHRLDATRYSIHMAGDAVKTAREWPTIRLTHVTTWTWTLEVIPGQAYSRNLYACDLQHFRAATLVSFKKVLLQFVNDVSARNLAHITGVKQTLLAQLNNLELATSYYLPSNAVSN